MTMNLHQIDTFARGQWTLHYRAKSAGWGSLADAYKAKALELEQEREAAHAVQKTAIAEARADGLNKLSFAARDPEIRTVAKRIAGESGALIDRCECAMSAYSAAVGICHRYGVTAPKLDDDEDPMPKARRVCCAKWWRRMLRQKVAQRTERAAIAAAAVHRKADLYISDAGLDRQRERRQANRELLESLTAINEQGHEINLQEAADASTANPELRRTELMTRIRGLEEIAKEKGDRAIFVTLTLPSRFHAVIAKTGRKNPLYVGDTPKDGQRWLTQCWARVRAALHEKGIKLYGLRCAEPHHDGTPHWHALLFLAASHAPVVRRAIFSEWLKDSPDEEGAKKYRVKIVPVTASKGSATGYIAKYLAKNVDGHQLAVTFERGHDGQLTMNSRDPVTAAERIRAWASTWRIRQFQFFGTPPVTIWRELRRLGKAASITSSEAAEQARSTADAGNYAGHVQAVGGVATPKKEHRVATWLELAVDQDGVIACTAYGDLAPKKVKGVEAEAKPADPWARIKTRLHTWTIQPRREVAPPWTRVNNCKPLLAANAALSGGPGFSGPYA